MSQCRNLITDVAGLRVGHAHDERLLSGVTVLLADRPLVAALDVRGGGPGTRETDALGLAGSIVQAHGIVLSGGSAFGLSGATGVQSWLAERGVGLAVGEARVPIVPQAILFDLLNGGDKAWGAQNPYEALGRAACEAAVEDFAIGSVGAGIGATTATLRGGLGSTSARVGDELVVGALAAVNAVGSATIADTAHFWAAPFEIGHEFGGLGWPAVFPPDANEPRFKGTLAANTTLAIVATNARLDRAGAHRLAIMAQAGLARAVTPIHTPLDGDVVFAVSTEDVKLRDPLRDLARLGAVAATTLARAVARAVYEAAPESGGWSGPPAYKSLFAGARA